MTQPNILTDIIQRLEKRAKDERSYVENNIVVADLLEPQMALFNAREAPWNTYAVRMAIDHRQEAKKGKQFADDLDAVCLYIRGHLKISEV